MTDDEWEQKRKRIILAAFQTGRPIFGDSDGALRFVDGDRESVPDDIGAPKAALPVMRTRSINDKPSWLTRIRRWVVRSRPGR